MLHSVLIRFRLRLGVRGLLAPSPSRSPSDRAGSLLLSPAVFLDPLVPVEPSAVAQPLHPPVVAPEEVRPEERLAALIVDEHIVLAVEGQVELRRRRGERPFDIRGVAEDGDPPGVEALVGGQPPPSELVLVDQDFRATRAGTHSSLAPDGKRELRSGVAEIGVDDYRDTVQLPFALDDRA